MGWPACRVKLGHAPGLHHHQVRPTPFPVHKKKDSPSWQRRRERQAAARLDNAEEVVHKETENDNVSKENAEQANAKESETISTPENVVVNELSQTSTENDNTENEATIQVEEEDKEAEEASIKNVENLEETIFALNTVIEEITDEVCSDSEYLKMEKKQIEVEKVSQFML